MKYNPHRYQHLILGHLLTHKRANVHAGMGTGKTVATATAIDLLMLVGEIKKTLILAPKRVAISTWPAEFAKWDHLRHLRVSVLSGTAKARKWALGAEADIYVTNYEQIQWLAGVWGKDWPFDLIVADESTKLKSFRLRGGSIRARALAKCTKDVPRWINLTGTPAPNGLMDLWGQQYFTDFGTSLGISFTSFKQRWFEQDFRGFAWTPRSSAAKEIPERIAPSTITVRPEDWFEIEKPVFRRVYVDMPTTARRHYRDMEKEMIVELADLSAITAPHAAAKTTKCRQIANGFIRNTETGEESDLHEEKLLALEEVIEEAAGEPVLVAYTFTHDRDRILARFKQAEVLGSKPADIDRWNRGEIPILLAHPASCGHGLNLQDGGRMLAFFGLDWNLEQYAQIIERIGPMRQKQSGHPRSVLVYTILARETMDDVILERLESKSSVQDALGKFLASRQ